MRVCVCVDRFDCNSSRYREKKQGEDNAPRRVETTDMAEAAAVN